MVAGFSEVFSACEGTPCHSFVEVLEVIGRLPTMTCNVCSRRCSFHPSPNALETSLEGNTLAAPACDDEARPPNRQ
jgi:hypothetical protein